MCRVRSAGVLWWNHQKEEGRDGVAVAALSKISPERRFRFPAPFDLGTGHSQVLITMR
jgi:hypothetical protein